jgi:hypothetical protein
MILVAGNANAQNVLENAMDDAGLQPVWLNGAKTPELLRTGLETPLEPALRDIANRIPLTETTLGFQTFWENRRLTVHWVNGAFDTAIAQNPGSIVISSSAVAGAQASCTELMTEDGKPIETAKVAYDAVASDGSGSNAIIEISAKKSSAVAVGGHGAMPVGFAGGRAKAHAGNAGSVGDGGFADARVNEKGRASAEGGLGASILGIRRQRHRL